MSEIHNAHGILDVIHSITSNRESGQLEINSSGSHGMLLFNEGRLVDARLESLTGFPAVNAAVSLRDVQFSFNPSISVPRSSSIAPHERVVLQRFFGIETAEMNEAGTEVDWNLTPHQVVPLAAVDEIDQYDPEDTPTVEVERVASPVQEQALSETPRDALPETRDDAVRKIAFPLLPRRPVVYATLLVLVLAVGAIALIPKLKARRQSASSVAQQSSSVAETPTSEIRKESLPNSARSPEEVVSKSPATAQQETPRVKSGAPSTPVTASQHDESAHSGEAAESNASAEIDPYVQDLSGEWKVINTVKKTNYKSFGNMEIGFRLTIEQTGNDFTARGEKVSENGRSLPAASRTPIRVNGSIQGDKVIATFVEDGMTRPTNGRFIWKLESENAALNGTFVSTAANSSGKSAATRQQ
jgi:hypothetical protein